MMSLVDFFRKRIPLTLDARPNLNEKFIRFSFGQRLVHLASSSILVDTGARFCVLDRQTIANIAGVDRHLLDDYLYNLSSLSPPNELKTVPNFGFPFRNPKYIVGFSGIGCWTIPLPNIEIVLNDQFFCICTFFTAYRTRPILGMPFLENVKLILDRKKKRYIVLY